MWLKIIANKVITNKFHSGTLKSQCQQYMTSPSLREPICICFNLNHKISIDVKCLPIKRKYVQELLFLNKIK